MIRSLLFLLALSFTFAHADPIQKGMDLDLAKRSMTKAKYAGGDREFIYGGLEDASHSTSWTVNQGTLIAAFDGNTRKITALFYTLNCEPDIPLEKHFQFSVDWFDCESGRLLIQIKERGTDRAKQNADGPELTPTDENISKPEPEGSTR